MKQITLRTGILVAGIALLFACNNDDTGGEGGGVLQFTSQMDAPQTRATINNTWEGTEQVAVSIDGAAAQTFTAAANGTLTPNTAIYWASPAQTVSARAWYPASWTMQADQSTTANFQAADFIFAPTVSGITLANYGTKPLTFGHRTAKVTANLLPDPLGTVTASDLATATVRFYGYTAGAANTSDGTLTGSNNGEITPSKSGDTYTALLIPLNTVTPDWFIKVTIGTKEYLYKPAAGEANLAAGNSYTYEITVKKTGLDVTAVNNGANWSAGNGYSGQATVTTYTVQFDANGGTFTAGGGAQSQAIAYGSTAARPASPARSGEWEFDGWYTNASGGNLYDFGAVTNGIDLYAHWISWNESDFGTTTGITEITDNTAGFNLQAYLNGLTAGNYIVNLTTGHSFTSTGVTLQSSVKVSLRGNRTINIGSANRLFTLNDGNTKLSLRGPTLQGNSSGTASALVYIDWGEFALRDGLITGHRNNTGSGIGFGGGVYVRNGIFTMSGGSISGNSADNGGGGVFLASGGSGVLFTMSGGTISSNSADGSGGGAVNVQGPYTTFTMSGGAISGNTASYNTGGVLVSSLATFIKNGGFIHGRNANPSDQNGINAVLAGYGNATNSATRNNTHGPDDGVLSKNASSLTSEGWND